MAARIVWKKAQAQKTLAIIAADLATAFNVPAPFCFVPDYRKGADWQWRFDCDEVWTKAGPAECAVDISATFAHFYFRFNDPARAVIFDNARDRLNRFSGKWNNHETPGGWICHGKPDPESALEMFEHQCRQDFARVAEPNPDPAEVAAFREQQAAEAAQRVAYFDSLRVEKEARAAE